MVFTFSIIKYLIKVYCNSTRTALIDVALVSLFLTLNMYELLLIKSFCGLKYYISSLTANLNLRLVMVTFRPATLKVLMNRKLLTDCIPTFLVLVKFHYLVDGPWGVPKMGVFFSLIIIVGKQLGYINAFFLCFFLLFIL